MCLIVVKSWDDGMKEGEFEDKRFYYIKRHIRGEQVDHNWIMGDVHALPSATLPVRFPPDPDLLPILEQRLRDFDLRLEWFSQIRQQSISR